MSFKLYGIPFVIFKLKSGIEITVVILSLSPTIRTSERTSDTNPLDWWVAVCRYDKGFGALPPRNDDVAPMKARVELKSPLAMNFSFTSRNFWRYWCCGRCCFCRHILLLRCPPPTYSPPTVLLPLTDVDGE